MKSILTPALLAVAVGANATVLWDSVYTSAAQSVLRDATSAGSGGYSFVGQTFKMASTGFFSLDGIAFDLRNVADVPLTTQAVVIRLYESPDLAAFNTGAPVFDSTPIYSFGGTVSVASSIGDSVAPYANGVARITGISGITLDTSKIYGLTINTGSTLAGVPAVSYGNSLYVGDPAYTAGGGGWYYDRNGDGALIGTEWGFFPRNPVNQLAFSLSGTAQPVPEPASLAALGLGAIAVARKRRGQLKSALRSSR